MIPRGGRGGGEGREGWGGRGEGRREEESRTPTSQHEMKTTLTNINFTGSYR
jgi:hypothetical protein